MPDDAHRFNTNVELKAPFIFASHCMAVCATERPSQAFRRLVDGLLAL